MRLLAISTVVLSFAVCESHRSGNIVEQQKPATVGVKRQVGLAQQQVVLNGQKPTLPDVQVRNQEQGERKKIDLSSMGVVDGGPAFELQNLQFFPQPRKNEAKFYIENHVLTRTLESEKTHQDSNINDNNSKVLYPDPTVQKISFCDDICDNEKKRVNCIRNWEFRKVMAQAKNEFGEKVGKCTRELNVAAIAVTRGCPSQGKFYHHESLLMCAAEASSRDAVTNPPSSAEVEPPKFYTLDDIITLCGSEFSGWPVKIAQSIAREALDNDIQVDPDTIIDIVGDALVPIVRIGFASLDVRKVLICYHDGCERDSSDLYFAFEDRILEEKFKTPRSAASGGDLMRAQKVLGKLKPVPVRRGGKGNSVNMNSRILRN